MKTWNFNKDVGFDFEAEATEENLKKILEATKFFVSKKDRNRILIKFKHDKKQGLI
jgi:hypothetical protein